MIEIEAYAGIEPIGWDVGVSRPKEKGDIEIDVEDKLDALLGPFESDGSDQSDESDRSDKSNRKRR